MKFAIIWSTLLFTFEISCRQIPEQLVDVDKDVRIELYTLKNPNEAQLLSIGDSNSVRKSNYNAKNPTRIFIHGFQSDGSLTRIFIDAFFNKGMHDVNLIAINWEKASNTINYPSARKSVGLIGEHTAKFIDFMVERKLLPLSELTVIGFSLGAHVAGFTGKNVRSGKLPKIVGLDPAAVLFSIDKPHERLNNNDATYVETIQTSKLGFFDPIGKVSFYPNGGLIQPGCSWDRTGACSHSTAYKYFAQSVYFDMPLFGTRCGSLDDVIKESCTSDQRAILGGEPGAMEQPGGMYYIRMVADPDKN